MFIAVIGCTHGNLDRIYTDVKDYEMRTGNVIDLVVICGDLQAARGINDLKCMDVPERYEQLGDFHNYYKGKKHARRPTLVIGGNQEAWNYLQTLPYGGWIAPDIYYMGYSGVVKFNGVRIGGLSGIYNAGSIDKGRHEMLPYSETTKKTVYHTRYLEAFRMLQLTTRTGKLGNFNLSDKSLL